MRNPVWTRPVIHRQLLLFLERPGTSLVLGSVRNGYAGHVTFADYPPYDKIEIRIDANNHGEEQPITLMVLHELLHVMFMEMFRCQVDGTVEEALVLGLEKMVWEYIKASPTRQAKWDRLIVKKLKESRKEPDASYEDLVDRSTDAPPS